MKGTLFAVPIVLLAGACASEGPPPQAELLACGGDIGEIRPPAGYVAGPFTAPALAADLPPAPREDRVGFPASYQEEFKHFYRFDRVDMRSVVHVCANDVAAQVQEGEAYPHGSVLLMENWSPLTDADDNLVYDSEGRLIRSVLNTVGVMRKGPGFGEEYGNARSGEWEYVTYFPDGSVQTPPEGTASCASCHAVGATAERDFVFRTNVRFLAGQYSRTDPVQPDEIGVSRMAYRPATRAVPVGTTVVWRNSSIDETPHAVVASDGSFASGLLAPGETFSHTFAAPGRYEYSCTLHPAQMRGTIEVAG